MRVFSCALALAAASLALAQEPALFKAVTPTWSAGDTEKWSLDVQFKVMEQDASFSGVLLRKVLSVDPNGDYEAESQLQDAKVVLMGSTQEQPQEPHKAKFHKDGSPVVVEPVKNGLEEVITAFLVPTLPTEGAKVGDTWKLESHGRLQGKGEVKLAGTVEWQGKKCLRLDITYTCSEDGTATGQTYLDAATGRLLGVDAKFAKVHPGPGIESDGTVLVKAISPSGGTDSVLTR